MVLVEEVGERHQGTALVAEEEAQAASWGTINESFNCCEDTILGMTGLCFMTPAIREIIHLLSV